MNQAKTSSRRARPLLRIALMLTLCAALLLLTGLSALASDSWVESVGPPSPDGYPEGTPRGRGVMSLNAQFNLGARELCAGELLTVRARWHPAEAAFTLGVCNNNTGFLTAETFTGGSATFQMRIPRDANYMIHISNPSTREVSFHVADQLD
ncbi:MAG: hypothetical protein IJC43_08745 [Clostridia bacterium]|nr:hypothetical protein [Clostridia bacterium]